MAKKSRNEQATQKHIQMKMDCDASRDTQTHTHGRVKCVKHCARAFEYYIVCAILRDDTHFDEMKLSRIQCHRDTSSKGVPHSMHYMCVHVLAELPPVICS